jgi:hypothetical protein
MHVSRFDPNNPDSLVFGLHENSGIDTTTCSAANPGCGSTLYNARTGALVFGTNLCVKRDFGSGMASALDPFHPGYNLWGGNQVNSKYWLYNLFGRTVGTVRLPQISESGGTPTCSRAGEEGRPARVLRHRLRRPAPVPARRTSRLARPFLQLYLNVSPSTATVGGALSIRDAQPSGGILPTVTAMLKR